MPIQFEATHTEGLSRLGTLKTPHGAIQTPALLPVINPNLLLIDPATMQDDHGVQAVITNAYIIKTDDALHERTLEQGVHDAIGFNGPIMTDSGTFQDYVYGDLDLDPHDIVDFQRRIGTDIGTILDIFSTPDRSKNQARQDVDETTQRAKETLPKAHDMTLALPIQGATYPQERERAARHASQLEPPGGAIHPIGGVVPLMEDQRYATLTRIILAAKRGLTPKRAVHLFGAGHPQMLPLAVYLGCDLFDSAAYAKFAHDERLLFPWGTVHLNDLDELPCTCPACHDTTPDELNNQPPYERAQTLAHHNLHATMQEMKRIRQAQREGRLFDLVTERLTTHPHLARALTVLQEHTPQLEQQEPTSSKRGIQLLEHTYTTHPQTHRAHDRIETRFHPRGPLTLLDPTQRPFTANAQDTVQALRDRGTHPFFPSRLGPVPYDLDEAYPFSQCLEPPLTHDHLQQQAKKLEHLAQHWDTTTIEPQTALEEEPTHDADLTHERVEATAAYQFGPHAATALLEGTIRIETSPRTGRVRTVHANDEHILSRRAYDGLFTLKLAGARRIHEAIDAPRLRIQVQPDSALFNADGKTVFAKFTLACDQSLRPGDECLIVDPDDTLVACGRLTVTPQEALELEHGPAAKVREGIGKDAYKAP